MIKKQPIPKIGTALNAMVTVLGFLLRFARTKVGMVVFTFVALYIALNDVLSPKSQDLSLLAQQPSGLKSIDGGGDLFMAEMSSRTKEKRTTTAKQTDDHDDICYHYDGILLISYADKDGFATVFFFFVLNQLLYAEKHNLLPWIHLDSHTNSHVYDDKEHKYSDSPITLSLNVLNGLHWDEFHDDINDQIYKFPGAPILDYKDPKSESSSITLEGTGIWSSYFDPPSRLDPIRHLADPTTSSKASSSKSSSGASCHTKPIFQLTLPQIEPSLMVYCPYCVRAWRRKSTPPALAQWNTPYQQWFEPMRHRANWITQRHMHPTEEMIKKAHHANPVVESEESCLAVHIRHSDKADRRKRIELSTFRPYIEAYLQASLWVGTTIVIYIATDSNQVLKDIYKLWPKKITSYMRYQEGNIVRSDNTTAVFELSQDHHRTNSEVFVDILAMAQCEFMVHGMSAVTEAAHYLNLRLHNQSVNLEEDVTSGTAGMNSYLRTTKPTMSDKEFGTMVRNRLHQKRQETDAKKKELDHN